MGTLRSEAQERAPSSGRITGAKVGSSGELIVFVANPASPPPEPPARLPADCPGG
jgi:hypothetical protein